jgi:hypothetical protein
MARSVKVFVNTGYIDENWRRMSVVRAGMRRRTRNVRPRRRGIVVNGA